jgi:hypothetical protein
MSYQKILNGNSCIKPWFCHMHTKLVF